MGICTRALVLGILVLATQARADAPPAIADAIKQAASAHKPLVLEFGAQWCGPCKLFESKVLPDAQVQAALKGVMFVRYDVDDDVGGEAAARYSVTAYPTFLVVDRKGTEVSRKQGLLPPLQFVDLLGKAKEAAFDEAEIRAYAKDHASDVSAQLIAAQWFAANKLRSDAIRVYDAISTAKNATADQRTVATSALVHLRRVEQWTQQLRAEKAALIRANPAAADEDDLLIATVSDVPATAETRKLLADVIDAKADANRLNHLAYVALAAHANAEAVAAAKRLNQTATQKPEYLDTLAECYYASGDRSQAFATAQQAVILAEELHNEDLAQHLGQNRDRFYKGSGEAAEVTQIRSRAADLWKRVEMIDTVADAVVEPRQQEQMREQQSAFVVQYRVQRALSAAIAKNCITQAVDNEQAFVRVELDADGLVKSSVLMLEPNATAALRDCITKQLSGKKLVADPSRPKRTLAIDFRRPH